MQIKYFLSKKAHKKIPLRLENTLNPLSFENGKTFFEASF